MTPTPEQAAAAVFASLDYGPHAVVKRIDALITALAAVQAERDELLARLGVAEQRVEVADHLIRFLQ